ncbi:hypothetical protein F511_05022 [Dorcoceras hygrometricum]|uniref:Uncharacterized protein n=1 Tax=Dorcoceras hygrometricum TaxID=472368 RepID=A0A2Z7AN74_9LAMI|nr:hypothetical protein F511_05022 [Dorcoceras hygrometricum]
MVAEEEQVARAVGAQTLGPKKGSVLPAKRRSVKKMMLDEIIGSLSSCLQRVKQKHQPRRRTLHHLKKIDGAGIKEKTSAVFPNP